MDVGFISTHFFCIFLDLSAPLFLVICDNHSIRKRVSCKSKGVKFSTFSIVLLTSFQVRFLSDFVTFLRPSGAPFGIILEKKTFPKIALKKKGPPT